MFSVASRNEQCTGFEADTGLLEAFHVYFLLGCNCGVHVTIDNVGHVQMQAGCLFSERAALVSFLLHHY